MSRCSQEYDGRRCGKRAGHPGPHYAYDDASTGVAWGNLDAAGWPR